MKNNNFFKMMAQRESSLQRHPTLAKMLADVFEEYLGDGVLMLKKQAAITDVACLYQHFGFCVFSPAARHLVASQISLSCLLEEAALLQWLEAVCYLLLEDFNILRIIEGEPDWTEVDDRFFKEISKRVICAESGEFSDLGLDIWNPDFIRKLRDIAAKTIDLAKPESLEKISDILPKLCDALPYPALFESALLQCLESISANPLLILVWRVECFSTFSNDQLVSQFFVRTHNSISERKASRLAALLALMAQHRLPTGEVLLPDSPLGLFELESVLKDDYTSEYFDCTLLRAWIGSEENQLRNSLKELVTEAKNIGLVFEVPTGNKRTGYGLSRAALRIIAPFKSAITQSLLKISEVPVLVNVEAFELNSVTQIKSA